MLSSSRRTLAHQPSQRPAGSTGLTVRISSREVAKLAIAKLVVQTRKADCRDPAAPNGHARDAASAVAHEGHFLHEARRAAELVLRHRSESDLAVVGMIG